MHKRLLLFILILGIFVNVASSKSYYFSSVSGDDRHTVVEARNPKTPWKSLDKLNVILRSLSPGDSVLFKRGEVFYGSINLSSSGLDGKPIVFGTYGQGLKPVITSLVDLVHWKKLKAGIYEAEHPLLEQAPQVVIMDGTLQEMGRYPNSSAPNRGYLHFQETNGEDAITDKNLSSNVDWTGAELVIRKSRWTLDRHRIISHKGGTMVFTPLEATYKPVSNYGYFVQGHINTLDEEGEWYFDVATNKLLVFFGEDSIPPVVQAATKNDLVSNQNPVRFLTFSNLHFKGANQNGISITNSSHVTFEHCHIEFSGVNGVNVSNTSYFSLLNSQVTYSLNNAVDLKQDTPYARILNNLIECTNLFAGMGQSGNGNGAGIQASSSHNQIIQNKVINTGYSGIRFSGDSTIVKGNLVDQFCLVKDDGGGIYTWTGSSKEQHHGREIVNNIVLNGKGVNEGTPAAKISNAPAEGIYLDDYASGIEIGGNTVANVSGKGIFIHNARDLLIHNNILYNNNDQISILQDASDFPTRNNIIRDNLFVSREHDQKNVTIRSNRADIEHLSVFEKNRHINFVRAPVISVHYVSNDNLDVAEYFDLAGWQDTYTNSDVMHWDLSPTEKFASEAMLRGNLLSNSDFDRDIKGYYCFSPSDNCVGEWDGGAESGSLKVSTQGQSFLLTGFGAVEQSKAYILRFTASADKDFGVRIFLRQSQAPYHPISKPQVVFLGRDTENYELLFDKVVSEEQSTLVIEAGTEERSSYWLDNMSLQEAGLSLNNTKDQILFSYNHSSQKVRQNLGDKYIDISRGLNVTSFTIEPFSSVLLWRRPSDDGFFDIADE